MIYKGLFIASVVLLGVATPVSLSVNAAEKAAEKRSGTTNATATFTANNDTNVSPVDPNDPTKIATPQDGSNGATPGSGLSLIYVPKNWNFGKNNVPVQSQDISLLTKEGTSLLNNKTSIQVSDSRGTNSGWNLSVLGSQFSATIAGDSVVKSTGIQLILPQGDLSTPERTANGVTASASDTALTSETRVLNATTNNGGGITVYNLPTTAIKLRVPGNSVQAGTYSTVLNWTLSDAPK